MKQEEILQKVQSITIDKLGIDEVLPEHEFERDLGADSLDVVELIMEFENEFNVHIPDECWGNIKTVQEAIEDIEKQMK